MFKAISNLFANPKQSKEQPIDTKLAVAALLVHLTDIDGETTKKEQEIVSNVLREHFQLDAAQVEELIKSAHVKDDEAVDFYQFTSIITRLEMEQRIKIIAMMWQVVFADGKNHELEDNMIWRVAELIGVSSRDRTKLRSQIARELSK